MLPSVRPCNRQLEHQSKHFPIAKSRLHLLQRGTVHANCRARIFGGEFKLCPIFAYLHYLSSFWLLLCSPGNVPRRNLKNVCASIVINQARRFLLWANTGTFFPQSCRAWSMAASIFNRSVALTSKWI